MWSAMKNFNIVRIDSKGRIIVPFHIRDYLGLKEGTELIVSNNGKKELRIFPLNDATTNLSVLISDSPGSLAKVIETVADNRADILISMSKTVIKGKSAEWTAIIDTSECDVRKLEKDLKSLGVVRSVEVKGN